MSQCHDEAWWACDELSGNRWRRRSLFSSERLDLILSNLRRSLVKSVDGSNQCKQISRDVTEFISRDADLYQQQQQRQQQQQQDAVSRTQTPVTCRRYVSTAGGGDYELDNPVTTKIVVESSDRHNDVVSRRTRHRHADITEPTVFDTSSLPDACRIKKSLSFRTQPQRPSCTDEAVRNVTSCMRTFRSLSRPARQPSVLQQQCNQSGELTVTPATGLTETSRNRSISSQDSTSVNHFSPNQNDKRSSASKRSQSPASRERNTFASKLMTQRDTDVVEQSKCCSTEDSTDNMLEADRHRRRPADVNWYVDLSDVASNDLRVGHLQQHQGKGNCGADAGPCSTTKTWNNAGDQRVSTTTGGKLDQLQHRRRRDAEKITSTAASTSPLDYAHDKFTPLQRSLSLKHSPKTIRTSEQRTGKEHGSSDEYHTPNDRKYRRSRSMTRPKDQEAFRHVGSAVQPAERSSTRTRAASLSERYRTLTAGDSSANFATSSAVVGRQKPVKPFELSRKLKADFVIYV